MKRMIRSFIRWALYSDDDVKAVAHASVGSKSIQEDKSMHFTVTNATGGKVIQFHAYNPSTRQDENRLYIITNMDNFGEELSQIILTESMSR
jgi:hypothetical protein